MLTYDDGKAVSSIKYELVGVIEHEFIVNVQPAVVLNSVFTSSTSNIAVPLGSWFLEYVGVTLESAVGVVQVPGAAAPK